MKRTLLFLILSLFAASGLTAQPFQAGEHYRDVSDRGDRVGEGPVEVVEFFAYTCVHCYNMVPMFNDWADGLAENVSFRRVPVVFNPTGEVLAKAYYAAVALDKVDDLHMPLFRAIHDDRKRLDSRGALRDFFAEHGVDPEEFDKAFDSFQVDMQVRRARTMARRYQVRSTPSLGIAGRYISDPGEAGGGYDALLRLGDWLVDRELSRR
jgi:protein dithiol oxidoreductase (disulfide-forming)